MPRFIPIIRKKTETTENPFWISYADLMTALVILFLVVMSISIVAISARPIVEKKERETEIQAILTHLKIQAKAKKLELNINRTDHTISFGNKARFSSDSYQLTSQAQDKLRAFVPIMLEAKNTKEGKRWLKRIHIEGYTDETGSYLYNVHLSLKRAEAVICALLSGKLSKDKQQQLQQLLIIDGASVTGIKESREESRRMEVRLEFRLPGDTSQTDPLPEMPLGYCVIDPKNDLPLKPVVTKPTGKKVKTPTKDNIKQNKVNAATVQKKPINQDKAETTIIPTKPPLKKPLPQQAADKPAQPSPETTPKN
jgi:outer membrane protein OmpA-like peptidoglycan-associated protein